MEQEEIQKTHKIEKTVKNRWQRGRKNRLILRKNRIEGNSGSTQRKMETEMSIQKTKKSEQLDEKKKFEKQNNISLENKEDLTKIECRES